MEQQQQHRTAWERQLLIRDKNRPTVRDYIPRIFTDFYEMHGDRNFGDDGAIIGGIGRLNGLPVTILAQVKGRNLRENKASNFAMPHPEGYRKALRLAHQAEKFHRPIICLIDTPGAFCGVEAEERGQGEAIARNIAEFMMLKTPVISVVLGIQTLCRYLMGRSIEGFTTVILLLLIIGGCIMLSLGIIGHYIAKIYDEVKGRPQYIISETTAVRRSGNNEER